MKKQIILLVILLCSLHGLQAQKKLASKHVLRPGLSIGYLPTLLLDDFHGNKPARVFMIGLYGHQEIWKESFFTTGLAYGKIDEKNKPTHTGIILPIKLQKFFTPDRKGLNLSVGLMMNYCKSCNEQIEGAFSNEISYLFSGAPVKVNAGLQFVEGHLFNDPAIHLGVQVQLIYHPRNSE